MLIFVPYMHTDGGSTKGEKNDSLETNILNKKYSYIGYLVHLFTNWKPVLDKYLARIWNQIYSMPSTLRNISISYYIPHHLSAKNKSHFRKSR